MVVATLLSLPGNVSGADTDAFQFSSVLFPVVGRWEWVSCESEGDVAFTPEALVTLKVPGPPGHPEAKVPAVGMLSVSVLSDEVLRVWALPAVPSPGGDERAREERVLLTLSALVAAGLSVVDEETAELGSVPSVVLWVSWVSVVMEEVTVRTAKVLNPDTLSPWVEADGNRGTLAISMTSPAEMVS